MHPFISVIIPVYNTENYLRKCLDSVLAQSFADFEVLLINDGSTDGSGKICDEYAKKDKRIKVFHKENGGVSSARNLGLDNAKGEWITFVDSDDYVNSRYFEHINANIESDIDVLVFGYTKIDLEGNKTIKLPVSRIYQGLNVLKILESTSTNMSFFWFPVTKVYNKDIIKSIRFNHHIKIGEDTIFNLKSFEKSKKIKVVSESIYFYCFNEISATNIKYRNDLLINMENHFKERRMIHHKKEDLSAYYIDHILFWLLKNEQNNPVKDNNLTALKEIRNSIIYKKCFPNYKYNWKHPKKSLIIKLFELRMYKLLLKIY